MSTRRLWQLSRGVSHLRRVLRCKFEVPEDRLVIPTLVTLSTLCIFLWGRELVVNALVPAWIVLERLLGRPDRSWGQE